MRTWRTFALVLGALLLALSMTSARAVCAKPNAKAAAHAKKAEREAKRHEKKGDLPAAREAWKKAVEHDDKPASRLSLARVEAELGNLLEAASVLEQVIEGGHPAAKKRQAKKALKRLEAKIPTLLLVLPKDFSGEVTLDERALSESERAEPIRLDPGEHALRIESPGHLAFDQTLDLAEGERRELAPKLEETPSEAPPPPVPVARRRVEKAESGTPATRVLGIASLVVGAAGVAVGTGFGLASMSTRDELDTACANGVCSADQRETYDRGRQQADIATAGFIVGGVGLGAGVILLLVSPSSVEREQPATTRVRPILGYRSVGARVDF